MPWDWPVVLGCSGRKRRLWRRGVALAALDLDDEALGAEVGVAQGDEQAAGDPTPEVVFEPEQESVRWTLLPAYMRTMFYATLIDSAAGEQGARRNAMKAATDNANEMQTNLTRLYNRVRQGAITTELNEIVGGAAALED